MATPLKPALVRAQGKDSVLFVETIADITAPTVTELTAESVLNLSCSLFSDQEFITGSTDKVSLPVLLCETSETQVNGPTTYTSADIVASFRPQDATGADGKKVWEALTPGTEGYLVRRQGIDPATDVATGDFVDVAKVTIDNRTPGKSSTDAGAVYNATYNVSAIGSPEWNVPVVAGA